MRCCIKHVNTLVDVDAKCELLGGEIVTRWLIGHRKLALETALIWCWIQCQILERDDGAE